MHFIINDGMLFVEGPIVSEKLSRFFVGLLQNVDCTIFNPLTGARRHLVTFHLTNFE